MWFFFAIAPLSISWALVNPMFASPDEPVHMVRAQGVVRGDFKEPYQTDGIPISAVSCMAFDGKITADCMDLTWVDNSTPLDSTAETYPPLFHILAGVPSLFLHGLVGAYAMRIWMAVLCSSCFGIAATLLWRRNPRRWTVGGVVMATAPMVVFCASTVNPSGIAAALSAVIWAAGISVIRPGDQTPVLFSRVALFASLILFPLLRRDALFWEILILAVLALHMSRERIREFQKDRTLFLVLGLTALNMIWVWFQWSSTATDSFVSNSAEQGGGSLSAGFGQVYTYLLQMIGWFGWLDSPMTDQTFVMLMVGIGAFVVLGIASGPSPESHACAVLTAGIVVVPSIIGAVRHPYFQGRYLFPLFVGLMLMAGQAIASSDLPDRLSRRFFSVIASIVFLVQFFAFAQNLRRYAVGRTGTWNFIVESNWHPPMMSNLFALALCLVALLVACFCISRVMRSAPRSISKDNEHNHFTIASRDTNCR